MSRPKPPGTVAEIVAFPATLGIIAAVAILLAQARWEIALGFAAAYYVGFATAQVFGASARKKPTP